MASRVSKIYGDAYVSLKAEEGKRLQAAEEVMAMKEIMKQDEELIAFLCHPQITKKQKMETVENILGGKASDDMMGFLMIIIKKGRWDALEEIFDYILEQLKKLQGIGILSVTSAFPLSQEQKKKIEGKVLEASAYQKLDVSYQTDASILGGLILSMDDRVVDSSVRTKLDSMAKHLSKIQV